MFIEIAIALRFLTSHLYTKLPRRRVNMFGEELEKQLKSKYQNHWHPDRPFRGSGFRSLKFNLPKIDRVIHDAVKEVGMDEREILECLPNDMIIWIDPGEVSYRIGERGQVIVLYKKDGDLGLEYSLLDRSSNIGQTELNNKTVTTSSSYKTNASEDDSGCSSSTSQPPQYDQKSVSGSASTTSISALMASSISSSTSPLFNDNSGIKSSPLSDMSSSLLSYGNTLISSGYESSNASYRSSPVFTTATFAQTKFGSTKLKSSSRRYSRMLPDEFSEYIKRRSQQVQQHQNNATSELQQHHSHSRHVDDVISSNCSSNQSINSNAAISTTNRNSSHQLDGYLPNNLDYKGSSPSTPSPSHPSTASNQHHLGSTEELLMQAFEPGYAGLSNYKHKSKTHLQRYSYVPSVFTTYHNQYRNSYPSLQPYTSSLATSTPPSIQQQPSSSALLTSAPLLFNNLYDYRNSDGFCSEYLTNLDDDPPCSKNFSSPLQFCHYCADSATSSLDTYNGNNVNYGNYNSGTIYRYPAPQGVAITQPTVPPHDALAFAPYKTPSANASSPAQISMQAHVFNGVKKSSFPNSIYNQHHHQQQHNFHQMNSQQNFLQQQSHSGSVKFQNDFIISQHHQDQQQCRLKGKSLSLFYPAHPSIPTYNQSLPSNNNIPNYLVPSPLAPLLYQSSSSPIMPPIQQHQHPQHFILDIHSNGMPCPNMTKNGIVPRDGRQQALVNFSDPNTVIYQHQQRHQNQHYPHISNYHHQHQVPLYQQHQQYYNGSNNFASINPNINLEFLPTIGHNNNNQVLVHQQIGTMKNACHLPTL